MAAVKGRKNPTVLNGCEQEEGLPFGTRRHHLSIYTRRMGKADKNLLNGRSQMAIDCNRGIHGTVF
jgi:hypothetical protein